MKRLKTLPAQAALLFLFLLAACAPRTMDDLLAWRPDASFEVEGSWEAELPACGGEAVYTVSGSTLPGLDAKIQEGRLVLTASQAGTGTLTLSVSAKGYRDAAVTIPVTVSPHEMELAWELGRLDGSPQGEAEPDAWTEGDTLFLTAGTVAELELSSKAGEAAVYQGSTSLRFCRPEDGSSASPAELGVSIAMEGSRFTFSAGEGYGEGTLEVSASAPNYRDAAVTIPVRVVLGRTPLSLSAHGEPLESLELENGSSADVTFLSREGAQVDFALAGSAVQMEQRENTLILTGVAPGEAVLEFSARQEGWLDTILSLPVRVTKTAVSLAPDREQAAVPPGGSVTIPYTLRPQDAQVSASVSGRGFTAALGEGCVVVTAAEDAQGPAVLTIAASHPDYLDAQAQVALSVKLEPISLTVGRSRVTLEKGGTTVLPVSVSHEGCEYRVSATGGVEAEFDGDALIVTAQGDGTATLTASKAGLATATVTVEVAVAEMTTDDAYASDAEEIVRLTNEYRAENGLDPLEHLSPVDIPAALRARESAALWSHTRPDGQGFETVFAQYGLAYTGYGENLFSVNRRYSPNLVVQAWKDSPGHNANLLRDQFDGIGVGICQVDGVYYYCQLFVRR